MEFTPIDINTWKRGQMFYYFSKMAPTGWSVTVKLDVTLLKKSLDERKLKFFPAYLWLVTKCLNAQPEFRVAYKDNVLGFYDTLTPLYASFHDDDKTFGLMWNEYSDSFMEFYKSYIDNQSEFGNNKGVLCQPFSPPANAYTVSCVPWISFEHFAVHSYDDKSYFFPSVEAGKFTCENSKLVMPLSVTCHHATTDGYHVSKFLEQLQNEMNSFSQYIL